MGADRPHVRLGEGMGRRSPDHSDQAMTLVAEGPFKLMERLERLLGVVHLPAIPQVALPLGSR